MRISKHIHSCLLVEEGEKVILVDPGNYSAQEHALNIQSLTKLDEIAITHEHPDHMDIPTLKEFVTKFPDVKVFSTPSVRDLLANEKIEVLTTNNENVQLNPAPHEKIWVGSPVANVMVTLFDRLTSPGDSFTFNGSAEILALPLQAPWGNMTQAVYSALVAKPKIIIPIHDYHLKDEFRREYYIRLKDYFSQNNIDFRGLETGEIIEV